MTPQSIITSTPRNIENLLVIYLIQIYIQLDLLQIRTVRTVVDEDALIHRMSLLWIVRNVTEAAESFQHVTDSANLVVVQLGLSQAPQHWHELQHFSVHPA